jgi:hypothetical protein
MIIRPTSEAALICRGVVALMLVVLLGVSLAETQLNNLTQRRECVQAINIMRDKTGTYSFYLLGEEYAVRAVYDVARFSSNAREIKLESAGHEISIPHYITYRELQPLFAMWHKQFLDEALQFKRSIARDIQEIRQKTEQYIELYQQKHR